jgi:hypothetical protein
MKVINVIGIAAGVLSNTQVMAAATCDDPEVTAVFSDLFKCEVVMQCPKFGLNSANEFKTSYEEVRRQVEDTRYSAGQDNKKLLDLGTPGARKLAGMLVDTKVKVVLSLPALLTQVTAVSADYNASIKKYDCVANIVVNQEGWLFVTRMIATVKLIEWSAVNPNTFVGRLLFDATNTDTFWGTSGSDKSLDEWAKNIDLLIPRTSALLESVLTNVPFSVQPKDPNS